MEFSVGRAFILRDEAEAALVLSRAQLISTRSWKTFSYVLEARVFGSLGSQSVHKSLM
jgi:hypothetical protein